MTFSLQRHPYLPMYPNILFTPTDSTLAQKSLLFRQSVNSHLNGSYGTELIKNILLNYAPNKLQPQDVSQQKSSPHPAPVMSPGWFHQALASAIQAGILPLPRQMPEDLSMLASSRRMSDTIIPLMQKQLKPVSLKRKPPTSPQDCSNLIEKDRLDSLLYSQPTFYPILKDQVEKAHQSWRTSDMIKHPSSSHIHETGTLVPSLIDGEIIMGFNVWGEKRLCLPHLFRFVLNDVDLKAIDEACTRLQITCTTCTPAQLTLLHSRKILPQAVLSCGLIRKSDAERLTKFIRFRTDSCHKFSVKTSHCVPSRSNSRHPSRSDVEVEELEVNPLNCETTICTTSSCASKIESDTPQGCRFSKQPQSNTDVNSNTETIPVIHECFGRQLGLIHPDLYNEASSKCIECQTCHRLFAPEQFVGHTHSVTEVDHLNHWGFDSTNWRCYLRLYTGRRLQSNKSNLHSMKQTVFPNHESEIQDPIASSISNAQAHYRLEAFKIKFAQPIRLPVSLSAALRTVGLCASVAPIPPTLVLPDMSPSSETSSTSKSSFTPLRSEAGKECTFSSVSGPNAIIKPLLCQPNPSSISPVMLPQLTLRRLWAPNDGRIKVPPPPKPHSNRDLDAIRKRLQSGPPLLLHYNRVVSQAAADRYSRDFIPNVYLMPPLKPKSNGLYGRYKRVTRRYDENRRLCDRSNRSNDKSHSRSRSPRRPSSNSSGSRTRSISVSSTSSSSYSCDIMGKSRTQHPLSVPNETNESYTRLYRPSSSSSSATSIRVVDEQVSAHSCGHKNTLSHKPRSRSLISLRRVRPIAMRNGSAHSDSAVSIYGQQLSESKRCRCRSLTVPVNPIQLYNKKTLNVPSSVVEPRLSNNKSLTVSTANGGGNDDARCYPTYRWKKSPRQTSPGVEHKHDRAMAAAKAAQGAASRVCPGLWSRHFSNLNGSNNGTLDLPSAREPQNSQTLLNCEQLSETNNTPVLVTSPTKNSLPTAVLALESIWADLVRHINDYTFAVESKCGVNDARQRLFEQFINMQTCYATHIAALMHENQKLNGQLYALQRNSSSSSDTPFSTLRTTTSHASKQNAHRQATSHRNNHPDHVPSSSQSLVSNTQPHEAATARLYPHRSRKEPTRNFSERRSPTIRQNSHLFDCQSDQESFQTVKHFTNSSPMINSFIQKPISSGKSHNHAPEATPECGAVSFDIRNSTQSASTLHGIDKLAQNVRMDAHCTNSEDSDTERRSAFRGHPYFAQPGITDRQRINTASCMTADSKQSKTLNSDDLSDTPHTPEAQGSSPIVKRRALMPPCEGRPRLSLKSHSGLLT